MRAIAITAFGVIMGAASALPAAAGSDDWFPTLSIYGGYQTATDSKVKVSDGTSFTSDWEGGSFKMPPYWGARATWWLNGMGYDNLGIALDFSHTKVYASQDTLDNHTPGWSHFEFTDGMNLLTLNAMYRFPEPNRDWTPYLGAGLGVNVPHVEVTRPSGKTWDYQLGGVTGQLVGGVDYRFTEHFSGFTEIKLNYSHVNVDIDSGDTLKTNIFTGAVNIGVSYKF